MRNRRTSQPPRLLLLLTAVGILLLSGCSLVPAYERPKVALPMTLGEGQASPEGGRATPTQPLTDMERAYLRVYGFKDLEPLLAQALTHNTDYRLAASQVEQARSLYRIERASQLPQLTASAQGVRQQFDDEALQARYQQHVGAIGVGVADYELDFFGRVQALSQAARERYLATAEAQQAMRGAVLAETLRAYVRERSAARALTQWQAMDANQMALAALADRQFDLGLLSSDDRSVQRHAADQIHAKALLAKDEHQAASRAMQVLIGYGASWEKRDIAGLVQPGNVDSPWRNLDSSILLERPDVQQAEAELRAAHADIGAARAAFFPSIRITSAMGTASDSLGNLFDGSRAWQFMPQLNLPIFDYGRNKANLTLAEARKDASVAAYEKAVEQAFREVNDALDAQTTAADVERREHAEVERVRQRCDRLNLRAKQGLEDQVTVLSGGIEAGQAELTYLQAVRDTLIGRIAVFQAFYGIKLPTQR